MPAASLDAAAAIAAHEAAEAAEAYAIRREMVTLLEPTASHCPHCRDLVCRDEESGQRMLCSRGCHRDSCRTYCGRVRGLARFKSDDAYIRRVVSADAGEGRMSLHMRMASDMPTEGELRAVARRGGQYTIVHTSDLSEIRHRREQVCPSSDTTTPGHVWVVTLPIATTPPASLGLSPVRILDALRALGTAHRFPLIDPDATRQRVRDRSRGWGDDEVREPGSLRVEGPALITVDETRQVMHELGIHAKVYIADPDIHDAVGWSGSRGQSLAISMLLRGDGANGHVDVERVTRLGRWWLDTIPTDVGDGSAVADVLRLHLWYGPPMSIVEQLREAHVQDTAAATFSNEAASLMRGIRDYYRGRDHEAHGVVQYLLTC